MVGVIPASVSFEETGHFSGIRLGTLVIDSVVTVGQLTGEIQIDPDWFVPGHLKEHEAISGYLTGMAFITERSSIVSFSYSIRSDGSVVSRCEELISVFTKVDRCRSDVRDLILVAERDFEGIRGVFSERKAVIGLNEITGTVPVRPL